MKCFKLQLILIVLISYFNTNAQHVKIEYIAHATFAIESENGTRVLIDPYHSYRQLGYTFPNGIKADFVLLTHPHYDHDGSKYFSATTPVFRKAGEYSYNDIKFRGIASKHKGFEQISKSGAKAYNTIWVIETGEVKIAHLGDNQKLTEEEMNLLSDVDYVIGHAEDISFNLFKDNAVYIPNHYALPEISKPTVWQRININEWLASKDNINRLETNIFTISEKKSEKGILVFKPSTQVKEWSQDYFEAYEFIREGFSKYKVSQKADDVFPHLDKAIESAPFVLDGYFLKARLLFQQEKFTQVISISEKALARVVDIDWSNEVALRRMLAVAYEKEGLNKLAYNQNLWLVRNEGIVDQKTFDGANTFINSYGKS